MRVRFHFLRPGTIAKTLTDVMRDILDGIRTVNQQDEVQHDPRTDTQDEDASEEQFPQDEDASEEQS